MLPKTTAELLNWYKERTGSEITSFSSLRVARRICARVQAWPKGLNKASPTTDASTFQELCQELAISPSAARRALRKAGIRPPYTNLNKILEVLHES